MGKGAIDDKLFSELKAYCELNDLDTWEFINGILREEFMKQKWGAHQPNQPKAVKKEVPTKPVIETPPKEDVKVTSEEINELPTPPPIYKERINNKRDLYGE